MDARSRFEAKYEPEPNTGCWLWTAGLLGTGYGQFKVDGKGVGAHRFAYAEFVGPIPEGRCVLHKCDQPLCVNPSHLFLGDRADNAADMVKKGRQALGNMNGSRTHPERVARGERVGNSKLTEPQVAEIRAAKGESRRALAKRFGISQQQVCRICRGENWAHVPRQ